YHDASPVFHAAAASAPLLLIHGDRDELVPVAQSEEMERALRRAGRAVRFIRVRSARHNLAPVPGERMTPSQDEINRAIADFFSRTLRREQRAPGLKSRSDITKSACADWDLSQSAQADFVAS